MGGYVHAEVINSFCTWRFLSFLLSFLLTCFIHSPSGLSYSMASEVDACDMVEHIHEIRTAGCNRLID